MSQDVTIGAVLERRRDWCEERRRAGEEGVYLAQARALPLPPSLNDALRVPRGERAVIAEFQRRHPMRDGVVAELVCGTFVGEVDALGVSAVSLPTDAERWGMDYADILEAAQASSLPIICRDLIVDALQVTMARAHGASAVVLSPSVLEDGDFRRLYLHASDLGLDVVAEVRSLQEIEAVSRVRLGHADNGSVRMYCVPEYAVTGERLSPSVIRRLVSALPEYALRIADALEPLPELEDIGYEAFFVVAACPGEDRRVEALREAVGELGPGV